MAFTGFYACSQCKPHVVEKIARRGAAGTAIRAGPKARSAEEHGVAGSLCKVQRAGAWISSAADPVLASPSPNALAPTLVIYVLVALFVQKAFHLRVGLCPAHHARRIGTIFIGWAAILAGILGIVAAFTVWAPKGDAVVLVVLASIIVIFGGIVTIMVASRSVETIRVSGDYLFVKGCCAEYLAELPVWPGE